MTGDFAPPPGSHDAPQAPARPQRGAAHSAEADAPPARSLLRAGGAVAVTAWVAIGAGVALLIGISWSAALAWSDRELNAAQVGETGTLNALQVVPGMCLEDVGDDGAIGDTTVVACDEPHQAEAFTQITFDLARYPGDDEVRAQALEQCGTRLDGLLPDGSTWVAWTPSRGSWDRGDRVALCVAVFDSLREEPLSPAGIEAAQPDRPTREGQDA